MLQKTDAVKLQIPPAFRDRYVVRVTQSKFGPNSNDNPMITLNLEVVGKPNKTGSVDTEVKRGENTYQIAGLNIMPVYFTLVKGKALSMYIDFWEKANPGKEFEGVNEENPDREYLDGLLMEAILTSSNYDMRKELTDEEKEEKKAAGEQAVGEVILDEDGKPITRQSVNISTWLKKYTGDVPNPY